MSEHAPKRAGEFTPTKAVGLAAALYLAWRWWRYGPERIFPEWGGSANPDLDAALARLNAASSQGQAVNIYIDRTTGATYSQAPGAPPRLIDLAPPPAPTTAWTDPKKVAAATVAESAKQEIAARAWDDMLKNMSPPFAPVDGRFYASSEPYKPMAVPVAQEPVLLAKPAPVNPKFSSTISAALPKKVLGGLAWIRN